MKKVASELIKISKLLIADEDHLDCGFAIRTNDEYDIKDNFKDRYDREPTKKEWREINKDTERIERNAMKHLDKVLDWARDEGHNSNDELVGSCGARWDNKKGLKFIERYYEDTGELDTEEERAFFSGVDRNTPLKAYLEIFGIDGEDEKKMKKLT